MKYAIVYSSRTGNTRLLAETIKKTLPAEDCLYYGEPDPAALEADRIYAGFWTDRGTCDAASGAFLKTLTEQELFLFGTAGFGGEQAYFSKVLERTEQNIGKNVCFIGSFMCQGKMPMSVRERYVKMLESGADMPNLRGMIENFDRALTHPDKDDLENLKKAVQELA